MAQETELATLLIRLQAEFAQYSAELDKMLSKTDATTDKMTRSFDKVASATNKVILAIGAGAAVAIKSYMDWGNAVDDLSDKTGMSGEEASKFLAIAKRVGIGVDEANNMFARFSRSIAQATAQMMAAAAQGEVSDDVFTKLGVSTVDVNNQTRDTIEIYKEVREKLVEMEDGWQKTSIMMTLFGKTGADVLDVLMMDNAEIDATIKKAEAMGLVISSETAAGVEKFTRDLNGLKGTLTSLGMLIASQEIPKLQSLANMVNDVVKGVIEWKNANGPLADSILNVAASVLELAAAYKILAAAGLKIPAWMIPAGMSSTMVGGTAAVVGAAVIGGGWAAHKYASEQAAKAMAQGETIQFDPVTGLPIPVVEKRTVEDHRTGWRESYEEQKEDKQKKKSDEYLGIGVGGGTGGKSAFEIYSEETSALISKWEKQVQIEEMSRETFAKLLRERLDGLQQISLNSDEVLKKEELEYSLRDKIIQSNQQMRQEIIETADQQRYLGEITAQEYADIIKSLADSAETEKERRDLTYQYKQALVDVRNETASMARDQLSLGTITEEQYAKVLRQLMLASESESERLGYAIEYKNVLESIYGFREQAELKLDLASFDFASKADELEALERQLKELNKQFEEYQAGVRDLTDEQLASLDANIDAVKDRMRSVFRDYMIEQKAMAQETKEAWADALADLFTGDLSPENFLKRLGKEIVSDAIREGMGLPTRGGLIGGKTKKTDVNPYESADTAEAAQATTDALLGLAGMVGGASEIVAVYNAVQSVINMFTKPAESAATVGVTMAKTAEASATATAVAGLDALAMAAVSAADALASISAGGFLGFDRGGFIPAAASGMYTGRKPGPLPGGGRLIVGHPGELVFPQDVTDLVLDLAAANKAGSLAGNTYLTVNVYNAQNLTADDVARKIGKRVRNLRRGS